MILFNALWGKTDPFDLFDTVTIVNEPDDLTPNGVLCLQGGEDIAASIYGEVLLDTETYQPFSYRDKVEIALVKDAIKKKIPIIGICRGAQMLCAIDGGKLYQHVTRHAGSHHKILDTETGKEYITNSAHHQMMIPTHEAKILAVSPHQCSGYVVGASYHDLKHTPEIVYFPKLNALGIQGHPEWRPNEEFNAYCASLIKQYLLKDM